MRLIYSKQFDNRSEMIILHIISAWHLRQWLLFYGERTLQRIQFTYDCMRIVPAATHNAMLLLLHFILIGVTAMCNCMHDANKCDASLIKYFFGVTPSASGDQLHQLTSHWDHIIFGFFFVVVLMLVWCSALSTGHSQNACFWALLIAYNCINKANRMHSTSIAREFTLFSPMWPTG